MIKALFFLEKPNKNTALKVGYLGLNSVFANYNNLDISTTSFLREILGKNIDIYAEVPVFFDNNLVNKFHDCEIVEASDKNVEKGWFCPSHEGIREAGLQKIRDVINLDINGVWLNFIRYPTNWKVIKPNLLDTCYCGRCLSKFEEYIGEKILGETIEEKALHIDGSFYIEWFEFKTETINSFVIEVKKIIQNSGKSIKLGIFTVPWEGGEYGEGIKRILGQDIAKISSIVNVYSPMLYYTEIGKEVNWIKNMINYYWQFGTPFLPLIKTDSNIKEVSAEEFGTSIKYACDGPSTGSCIFFLEDLLKQPEKVEKLKEIFAS